MPHKINPDAILAVAHGIAKAHHGDDVTDPGGYLQLAKSFIAAAAAMHEFGNPFVETAEDSAALGEADPVQQPVVQPAGQADKPQVGEGASA